MGYSAPRTWAALEKVRPYWLNTELRDNLAALRGLNGYACSLYLSGDQSVSKSNVHSIAWDAASYNLGSMWTSGTRLTIAVTGYYVLACAALWSARAGGERATGYRLNGGDGYWCSWQSGVTTAGKRAAASFRAEVALTAGDTVEFIAQQTTSEDLNLEGGTPQLTHASVRMLGSV